MFGDKRRNIRFEATCTDTHNDKTNGEDGDGNIRFDDNLRDSGEDEENVTNNGNNVSVLDGEVAAEVFISQPRSSEWCNVRPKGIDCMRLAVVNVTG